MKCLQCQHQALLNGDMGNPSACWCKRVAGLTYFPWHLLHQCCSCPGFLGMKLCLCVDEGCIASPSRSMDFSWPSINVAVSGNFLKVEMYCEKAQKWKMCLCKGLFHSFLQLFLGPSLQVNETKFLLDLSDLCQNLYAPSYLVQGCSPVVVEMALLCSNTSCSVQQDLTSHKGDENNLRKTLAVLQQGQFCSWCMGIEWVWKILHEVTASYLCLDIVEIWVTVQISLPTCVWQISLDIEISVLNIPPVSCTSPRQLHPQTAAVTWIINMCYHKKKDLGLWYLHRPVCYSFVVLIPVQH